MTLIPARAAEFASAVACCRLKRPGEVGMPKRLPARQVAVADAELDAGQIRPQPRDDRPEAAIKVARQKQVPDDQVPLAAGRDEVATSRLSR